MIASIVVSLALAGPAPAPPAVEVGPGRIAVHADARVELLSIIFRLAGNPEYNQPNSQSPYSEEVEARFGPFRDHAVITTARAVRKSGVSYDAVMSMAVHITDTETLEERIPFDERPDRFDARWRTTAARDFLAKTRDFVERTRFNEFVAEHQSFYEAAAARLRARVEERDYVGWFDGFFGARREATFHVITGLLNGGGNYGVGIRFPDGAEEITPVIGTWQFDDDGLPEYGDGITGTIVHEFCHSYTNPIVDRFADQLEPAGRKLYARCATIMKQQAYGNWKTLMYESLVRACTVRYAWQEEGPEAARRSIDYNHGRGFKWTGELSSLLAEYEADRDRYPTLDDFMPKVVAFFDRYAEEQEIVAARAPKVLAMTPANGAADVDPALKRITITFDRPMTDGSWSVVGGGEEIPETTGPPQYDDEAKVLTLPVRLKPGWSYRFQLNSARFTGFRSRDGVPLDPVVVTFTTRDE